MNKYTVHSKIKKSLKELDKLKNIRYNKYIVNPIYWLNTQDKCAQQFSMILVCKTNDVGSIPIHSF